MTELKTRLHPSALRAFLDYESAGGVLLIGAGAIALLLANTPLASFYHGLFALHLGPLSLLAWINDGLMTLFFLLVGLEIKREIVAGHLRHWPARILPGAGALGGMIVPAIIYLAVNLSHGGAPRGFAIASATDIAFALGVLSLLGSRTPASLKVFLTTLAILDDLGAVVLIALFYSSGLTLGPIVALAVMAGALYALHRYKVNDLGPYLLLLPPIWGFAMACGLSGALAGVLVAAFIPLRTQKMPVDEVSPLARLEETLHPVVSRFILPLFAFANAGVTVFAGDSGGAPVFWGVALGLFFGKQLGVFGAITLAVRAKKASWPLFATPMQIYAICILCGVGFTMSLFIGGLAFDGDPQRLTQMKLAVILSSIASAALGAGLLRFADRTKGRGAPI